MHISLRTRYSWFLGMLLSICCGCGSDSNSPVVVSVSAGPPTSSTPIAGTPSESQPTFSPAPTLQSPLIVSADEGPVNVAPNAPAPPGANWTIPGFADSIASATRARPPKVAIDVRTVTNQPVSGEIQKYWREKFSPLAESQPTALTLVENPADAEWLIQVAAIERPDIIYLAPAKPALGDEETPDEHLHMLPPGESAVEWLQAKLMEVSLSGVVSTGAASIPEGVPGAPRSSIEPVLGSGFADQTRAFLTHEGPAENLRAEIVQEQSGIYHTLNRTQALLGSYGKVIEGNRLLGRKLRFEQRGMIQQVDRVKRFTTVQRQGNGSGKDFLSFMGNRQAWQVVDLSAQVSGGHQHEVAFEIVGLRLDQNEVIKAMNADPDAMNYFGYLQQKKERPCMVLENIVFASYAASQGTSLNASGSGKTIFTTDSIGGRVETERKNFTQFTSPVVRCYQMYEVMLHNGQVVELSFLDP